MNFNLKEIFRKITGGETKTDKIVKPLVIDSMIEDSLKIFEQTSSEISKEKYSEELRTHLMNTKTKSLITIRLNKLTVFLDSRLSDKNNILLNKNNDDFLTSLKTLSTQNINAVLYPDTGIISLRANASSRTLDLLAKGINSDQKLFSPKKIYPKNFMIATSHFHAIGEFGGAEVIEWHENNTANLMHLKQETKLKNSPVNKI